MTEIEKNSEDFLSEQPRDILIHIFSLLEKKDFNALFLTSKRIRNLLHENIPDVWKHLNIYMKEIHSAFRILSSPRYSKLTTLIIYKVEFAQANLHSMLEFSQRTLKFLCLKYTQIGDNGAKAIAEILKMNILIELTLEWNEIGNEGARVIGEVLKFNKSLEYLNFCETKIGIEGEKIIAESLKINKTLQYLIFTASLTKLGGGILIGKALKVNISLTHLELFLDGTGNDAIKAIAKALQINRTLLCLTLSLNEIDTKNAETISETLRVNKSLKFLVFYRNIIKFEEGVMPIVEVGLIPREMILSQACSISRDKCSTS